MNRFSKKWPDFTGDQSGDKGFDDKKTLKQANLVIDGVNYEGEIRRYNQSGNYEVVIVAGPGQDIAATPQNMKHCERLTKKYSSVFGPPKVVADLSDSDLTADTASVDISAYWDINKSRIQLICNTIKVYKGFLPIIFISYGHQDDVKEIYNLIFLKCSRKKQGLKSFSDKPASEEPPFTITINPNQNRLQSKKIQLGKTTTFNDLEIISEHEDEKKNIKSYFILDRYAGSYIWTITITKRQNGIAKGSGHKYWGDCSKIDRGKKF